MRIRALRWLGLDTRRTHAPVARIAESPENLERNHRLRVSLSNSSSSSSSSCRRGRGRQSHDCALAAD